MKEKVDDTFIDLGANWFCMWRYAKGYSQIFTNPDQVLVWYSMNYLLNMYRYSKTVASLSIITKVFG